MAERIAIRIICLAEYPPVAGFRSRNEFELEIGGVVDRIDGRRRVDDGESPPRRVHGSGA
jgi:hypothetical protein